MTASRRHLPVVERDAVLPQQAARLALKSTFNLLGISAPERAQHVRLILSEFYRIADHIVCMGANLVDVGITAPAGSVKLKAVSSLATWSATTAAISG